MMKEGDFVRIDYVGTIKESGLVFDVTNEKEAKERELFNPQTKYGPIPVIIGAGLVVKGLEEELKKMKVGEKKKIELKPERAFGERNPKLTKIFPESDFTKQNMVPYAGMPVTIGGMMGRVLTNSGGRVKVDFNHPLAGKELVYDLEIKGKITKKDEKVKAVSEFYLAEAVKDVSIKEKNVEILVDNAKEINKNSKKLVSDTIFKWVEGIESVKFSEEYKK